MGDGASGGLDLDVAEIALLTNGFSSITIGKADSGVVDINAITFIDAVTIQGGAITVTALEAGSNNITLTSTATIDEAGNDTTVDIPTSTTLTMTAAGAIGATSGNGPLDLAVGTLQAVTNNGGIFLLESNALIIGGTGVQTTANNAAIEITLTAGNLTLDEDITANGSGTVTLTLSTADTAVVTTNNTDNIASTSGAITISADRLTLAVGTIASTGALIL